MQNQGVEPAAGVTDVGCEGVREEPGYRDAPASIKEDCKLKPYQTLSNLAFFSGLAASSIGWFEWLSSEEKKAELYFKSTEDMTIKGHGDLNLWRDLVKETKPVVEDSLSKGHFVAQNYWKKCMFRLKMIMHDFF